MSENIFYENGMGVSISTTHCNYATRLLRARARLNNAMRTEGLTASERIALLKGGQPAMTGVNIISNCVTCMLPPLEDHTTKTFNVGVTANWTNLTGEPQMCPNARDLHVLGRQVLDAVNEVNPPPRQSGPGGNAG